MNTITINDINYIQGEYILDNAPIYSKGCRSSRILVKNKNITDYIFARKIDNSWTQSDGKSAKFDKVFIKIDILKTIPELSNNNEIIVDDNGIEKAPDIIHLDDNEKFQDNDGNILDIETRGIRAPDKIYFKVKDISKSFDIDRLRDIVTLDHSSYKQNIDYKYFIVQDFGKINKKLFLTYNGLLKVINTSRKKFNAHTIYVLNKWLNKIDSSIINEYKIKTNNEEYKNGYIYFVTSDLLNAVKIGMWRSNISSLYKRYITVYGNNVNIKYFYVDNVRKIEKNIHNYFNSKRITNELFIKDYYDDYINYINYIK